MPQWTDVSRALVAAACVVSLAGGAAAAPPPQDAVLEVLVAEALKNNPDLHAAEEAVAAARQRPAQAAALPDPMVSTVFTNEGWSPNLGTMPDSTLAVMASQALPPRGDRGLRGRIAEREIGLAEQQLARARRGVEASVRRAYYSLAQARALRVLIDEQGEVWKQIEGVARARYSVGQGAQQDVLRVQVELTRVAQLRIGQEVEEAVRLAELNRLRGRIVAEPVETASLGAPSGAPDDGTAAFPRLSATSPEMAAARITLEQARLAVDLARVQFRPSFSVQAAYMNRGGLDPMWQAGVGMSLPLRKGWRKAGLAQAEAGSRSAESQLRSTELELRLRTEERVAQLAAARDLWLIYDEGIVPQGQMAVEAALASYRAGQVPFLTVLESLATLYGDRSTQVRLAAAHARARVSLEEASLASTDDLAAGGGPMAAGMGVAAGFNRMGPAGGAVRTGGTEGSGGPMTSMSGR
jgi:outer membrane protein TolC